MEADYKDGRWAAFGLLLSDICIFGDGLASLLGLAKVFDSIFWLRIVLGVFLLIYFYLIKKPRIAETPLWYSMMKEDLAIRGMWVAALVILALDILF